MVQAFLPPSGESLPGDVLPLLVTVTVCRNNYIAQTVFCQIAHAHKESRPGKYGLCGGRDL